MIEFLTKYYKEIIIIILMFLELFFSLINFIKKRKKEEPVMTSILSVLPSLIVDAESTLGSGKGDEKKSFVLELALSLYKHMTGVSVSLSSDIAKQISKAIEDILSTPTKKGVKK